ncbi:hypothetical protein ABE47_32575 [Bacillus thuringiensis]|nr:hypothetical protein [Bacillus thuringiensis]
MFSNRKHVFGMPCFLTKLSSYDKISLALRMYDSNEYSIKEIIEGTGVSQGSLYRAIQKRTLGKL